MATRTVPLILVALAVVAAMQPTAEARRTRRMIGGTAATGANLPGHVVQIEADTFYTCAGILVKVDKVVTLASCVADPTTKKAVEVTSLQVRVGSITSGRGGTLVDVKSIVLHPQWTVSTSVSQQVSIVYYSANAAVLNVASVTLSPTVSLAKIATSTIAPGTAVTTAGWGVTQVNSFDPAPTMQKLQFTVLPFSTCKSTYAQYNLNLPATSFCTAETPQKEMCSGDGGAPYEFGGVVWGLFSFNSCGASVSLPGVAQDLSKVRDFLQAAGAL